MHVRYALVHERTCLHVFMRVVYTNMFMHLCMYYLLFSFFIYRCSLTTKIYMFYLKIMLIYLPIFIMLRVCEIVNFFRLFILSYHVVYIVLSIDSGRWIALISNKG